MTCHTCHKPTPADSVHTCSPVEHARCNCDEPYHAADCRYAPMLTAEFVRSLYPSLDIAGLTPKNEHVLLAALDAIQIDRVACYDTQAGVFVPYMSENDVRNKFDEEFSGSEVSVILAALRDLGVVKP